MVNSIIGENEQMKEINNIIRNNIIAPLNNQIKTDTEFTLKFMRLHEALQSTELPRNKWNYGNNQIAAIRPLVDDLSKYYLDKYHKADFKKLNASLDSVTEMYKQAYGTANNDYKQTKLDDLNKRLGNAILSSVKNFNKSSKTQKNRINVLPDNEKAKQQKMQAALNSSLNASIYYLKRTLRSRFDSIKNQQVYDQMQQQIDIENDMEI